MEIKEDVNIKKYSTLKIGGRFRYFSIISSINDLIYIYNIRKTNIKYKNISLLVLGGGSNIVFSDGILNVLAVKMEIKGFEIVKDTDKYTDIKVGAGETWDNIVLRTVKMNLFGLESLSSIPGTVGATPVQNVGAYGAEVSDTILEVELYDIKNNKVKNFSNNECEFKYRNSIFKNEAKGKYIIISVTYRLNKSLFKVPNYSGIKKYLIENKINNPKVKDIREAVIYIRREKLPNPKELPNVGSFFKNPIIEKNITVGLKRKYDDLITFPISEKMVKVPAGWLIEKSGLKGKSFGNISVYDKNALVLINTNNATKEDLLFAKNEIINKVYEKFNIRLEQEPETI